MRGNVLQEIERNQRNFKLAMLGAAVFELWVLVVMMLLLERSNRTHLLLFVGIIGSYSIIVVTLIVLGIHINGGNLRVLKAIELLKDELTGNKQS